MADVLPIPKINDRAWFSLNDSLEQLFPTRVEDVKQYKVTIAAPLTHLNESTLTTLDVPPESQTCTFVWKTEAGYGQQACHVADADHGNVPLWTVSLHDSAQLVQRRAFVRIPEDAQMHLHFSDRSVDALLMDLSEGGLRCTTRAFSLGVEHFPVFTDLVIAGYQVLIPGQIIRSQENIEGTVTLAIQFSSIKNVHSDLIRRHVFGKQVTLRENGAA